MGRLLCVKRGGKRSVFQSHSGVSRCCGDSQSGAVRGLCDVVIHDWRIITFRDERE